MTCYPMHTAPQDGTLVLLWTDHPEYGLEVHVARTCALTGAWVARVPALCSEHGYVNEVELVELVPVAWCDLPEGPEARFERMRTTVRDIRLAASTPAGSA
ncbi:MAG: hypothetical protein ACU0BF_01730 [Paracoccaceae bacterium]